MKGLLLAAVLAASLTLTACAHGGSASGPPVLPTTPQDAVVDHPDMISPTHRYCMYVRSAGQLRECYHFSAGRCTYWGSQCKEPGWIVPPPEPGAKEAGNAPAP